MSKPRIRLDSPWVLFAAGFVGAVVVTRRLITLPASEVFFGAFDKREIDDIVNSFDERGEPILQFPPDDFSDLKPKKKPGGGTVIGDGGFL